GGINGSVQRFDAQGLPQGAPITMTVYTGDYPSVALNESGDMVIAWHATSGPSIRASRYDANGQAVSLDYPVSLDGQRPEVACAENGEAVISWQIGGLGAYARRFDAALVPGGNAIEIVAPKSVTRAPIALDSSGIAAYVWSEPVSSTVFARIYTLN